MDKIFKTIILVAVTFTVSDSASTPTPITCDSEPCGENQYCIMSGSTPICMGCDPACVGCTGFGEGNCKQCQLGYRNNTNTDKCEACPDNKFGADCVGDCHCLYGPGDCDQATGHCISLKCDLGWKGVPQCQTPCSDLTFGSNCGSLCHCPVGDNCSSINGLCSGGSCANGWSGAGCQNELPLLSNPPVAQNVSCENATIVWQGWKSGEDRGNAESIIQRYELYSMYRLASGEYTDWSLIYLTAHVQDQVEYETLIENLANDTFYKFRVDVVQQDGDKTKQMAGLTSLPVFIPCTETEPPVSTTVAPGTTVRPPGPYILDDSQFKIDITEDPIMVRVTWGILADMANYTLNLTLEYYLVKVNGTECPSRPKDETVIEISKDGSYDITDLLPWRQYIVQVNAESIEYNLTDFIRKDVYTPEEVPTGHVANVHVQTVNKNGGFITWNPPICNDRNGDLVSYRVLVYTFPDKFLALNESTNISLYEIQTLVPYTNYSIVILYVNSKGPGPEMPTQVTFTTSEDVPGPPSIESITQGLTTLRVKLVPPNLTNGILVEYKVTWATDSGFTSPRHIGQPVSAGTDIVIVGLLSDTQYFVKASARTSAGEGASSISRSATTLESLPDPPTNIVDNSTARNETCVHLNWGHDDPNVIEYNVTYSERGAAASEEKRIVTQNTSKIICDLKPGVYYDFKVVARSAAGYGTPGIVTVSTEQLDPPFPELPEVLNTTDSSIAVALFPVVQTSTTYDYGYLLSVDDVTAVQKRAVSTSNITCPGVAEIPGTVIKNFSQSEILTKTEFIVGDGKTYDTFINKALTKDHYYDIYYIITSNFEGVCKFVHVKASNIKAALIIPPVTEPTNTSTTNNTGLIIALVIIIIVIIIIIVLILLYCWWKRRQAGQKYEVYTNEKDDFDMKVYRVDDYNPQKYWNTIYSLRESRYITAGKENLPEEHKSAMNGSPVGIANGGPAISFHDEFSNLPHGPQSTSTIAKQRDNELKNRFSHLLPYDHSRVVLDPDINSDTDYINANFIKGYKHQHKYIAAQSPFDEETVLDFWRMIYQYETRVIVMMSNLVEDNIVKCTQFWPDQGRVMYGQFVLDLVDVQEFASYTLRTLRIRTTEDRDWQMLYIFDLTYWPEHGVPDDPIPLLEMRRKITVYQNRHNHPIVVHCGTGVSRSGVYIAVDSLLEQYEIEGRISVFSFVRKMRKDRPAMVRTLKQYIFIYEAIFEAMHVGDTLTSPADLKERYQFLTKKNPSNRHSYLHGQFKSLEEYTRKLFPTTCSSAFLPVNFNKNRFVEIVPPDMYRPILTTPGGIGRTDYINAVFLDSHRQDAHYLITQTPLHTTVIDFWKLVYDHEVHTIVMMEPMKYEDDTCAEYWPEDHMKQYEPFFVETADVYQQENITIRNLKLTPMTNTKEVRHIRQFQFNAWSDSEFIPKSKSMLLDVIDLVNDWQVVNNNDSTPILVHCKDGATHSGLFIAVSILCEKVQDENEVDILHTVKHMKRRRTQIVDTLDQYRFCYKALWDFINMRMPGGTLTEQMSKTRSDRPYNSLSLASYTSVQEHMPY